MLMYSCGNTPKPKDLVVLERKFGMSADKGAMARVKGITKKDDQLYIDVIWIDDLAHNQAYGEYYPANFKLVKRWVEEIAEKHKDEILDKWGGKEEAIFKKFYQIVEVSGKVSLRRLAEELDLGSSECRERVWDWAYILGYKVRDDHVMSLD